MWSLVVWRRCSIVLMPTQIQVTSSRHRFTFIFTMSGYRLKISSAQLCGDLDGVVSQCQAFLDLDLICCEKRHRRATSMFKRIAYWRPCGAHGAMLHALAVPLCAKFVGSAERNHAKLCETETDG